MKTNNNKGPRLEVPLSITAMDFTDTLLLKNTKEWVNRTSSIRRKETDNRHGHVTRPMNAFMLYRSAYIEVAKHWSSNTNQQCLSSIVAESWGMEKTEVRELFQRYARTERDNHSKTYPYYRFCPRKPRTRQIGNESESLADRTSAQGSVIPTAHSTVRDPLGKTYETIWPGEFLDNQHWYCVSSSWWSPSHSLPYDVHTYSSAQGGVREMI
jgi:hypothetical protein